MAGDNVSKIPAKGIERNRNKLRRGDHLCILSAITAAATVTIPPCSTCTRNATANGWRALTTTHARPTGGKNARRFSISIQQRSQSLRDL